MSNEFSAFVTHFFVPLWHSISFVVARKATYIEVKCICRRTKIKSNFYCSFSLLVVLTTHTFAHNGIKCFLKSTS